MPQAPEQPTKDPEQEQPVPLVWRPILRKVVDAIRQDPAAASEVNSVDPVPAETAGQIREYMAGYGETLVALPEASWESSVTLWMDGFWEILLDLWTEGEGRSDLVLSVRAFEHDRGYRFEVGPLYVP